jgi:hypothetical protein
MSKSASAKTQRFNSAKTNLMAAQSSCITAGLNGAPTLRKSSNAPNQWPKFPIPNSQENQRHLSLATLADSGRYFVGVPVPSTREASVPTSLPQPHPVLREYSVNQNIALGGTISRAHLGEFGKLSGKDTLTKTVAENTMLES